MKRFILVSLLTVVSCSSKERVSNKDVIIAQGAKAERLPAMTDTLEEIRQSFFFISSDCVTSVVTMVKGNLHSDKSVNILVRCSETKNLTGLCAFYEEKGKLISKRKVYAAIDGQQLTVVAENQSDVFNVNLVTKKYYSESNLYLEHGAIRGKKICTGDFLFESDYRRIKESN